MRKSASEIIRGLESRIAKLERESKTLDFFKSYKERANEIADKVNQLVDPVYATLSEPKRINTRGRQAEAVYIGFDLYNKRFNYRIVFLCDEEFNSPFEKGFGEMFTQSSFTFYLNGKAISTAENGNMSKQFLRDIKFALENVHSPKSYKRSS